MQHWMAFQDPAKVKGQRLQRSVVVRVWGYVKSYRWCIVGFLATVIVGSFVALANPFIIRTLLNSAIPNGDRAQVNVLAVLLLTAAIGGGLLSLLGRWWSSRIGEGLIYDLRTQLYDHIQRMPLAFFTNSQTGSLTSRLNSDVA